jgi:ribonuclease HII
MATVPSPAIRIYRRASARFEALREALARDDFHAVIPPDAIAEWECVDDAGTRVRCAEGFVVVEAPSVAAATEFDARYRLAFPSERAIPDGGDPPQSVEVVVGSDESGKGDASQAFAVAAVAVPCEREYEALARGVRDSKTCDTREIFELSHWIKQEFSCAVRVIAPEARDAALRAHGGNETRLLTALHVECLRECVSDLARTSARSQASLFVRVDRFASGRLVAAALAKEWPEVIVDECVRGERHVAVAAASIVARRLTRG